MTCLNVPFDLCLVFPSRPLRTWREVSPCFCPCQSAWLSINSIAVLPGGANPDIQSNVVGNVFPPKSREQFSYDDDGNLTSDGRWNYGWDAENRLIAMTNNTSFGPQQVLRFEYDAKGRRIHKQVWGNNVGNGSATNDVKFVYDGWNLLAVFSSPSTLLQSFLWGSDLSGSVQGAGGVGGLLEVVYYGTQATNCFVAFDGNGNVAALVSAVDGSSSAQYEYGPFGEVIRATGPMAKSNPFRFSTKYQDDEMDLLYYGYRYYSAGTGRWLNSDPAGEMGGINLYLFVANNSLAHYDRLGLWNEDVHALKTMAWARDQGISATHAALIGGSDNSIDKKYPTWNPITDSNWSWHFNRSSSPDPKLDSRLVHKKEELDAAEAFCTWSKGNDNPWNASVRLGYALHPLQDWVAHGDFNTKKRAPTLTNPGADIRYYWHNWAMGGTWTAAQPDDPRLDASGPEGRATDYVLEWFTLQNGDLVGWTGFFPGSQRITLTEKLTRELLAEFKTYVAQNAKPCGECWKAFLVGQ